MQWKRERVGKERGKKEKKGKVDDRVKWMTPRVTKEEDGILIKDRCWIMMEEWKRKWEMKRIVMLGG